MLALPSDQFPHLIGAAATAAVSDPVAEFRAGLEILIAGLDRAW